MCIPQHTWYDKWDSPWHDQASGTTVPCETPLPLDALPQQAFSYIILGISGPGVLRALHTKGCFFLLRNLFLVPNDSREERRRQQVPVWLWLWCWITKVVCDHVCGFQDREKILVRTHLHNTLASASLFKNLSFYPKTLISSTLFRERQEKDPYKAMWQASRRSTPETSISLWTHREILPEQGKNLIHIGY